jgi:hypothetical protein
MLVFASASDLKAKNYRISKNHQIGILKNI